MKFIIIATVFGVVMTSRPLSNPCPEKCDEGCVVNGDANRCCYAPEQCMGFRNEIGGLVYWHGTPMIPESNTTGSNNTTSTPSTSVSTSTQATTSGGQKINNTTQTPHTEEQSALEIVCYALANCIVIGFLIIIYQCYKKFRSVEGSDPEVQLSEVIVVPNAVSNV